MSANKSSNTTLLGLESFDIYLDKNAYLEFISYHIVIPAISLIGLIANLINITVFMQSSQKGDLHKYLLGHSVFTCLDFFFNLIYSIEILLNDCKIQSTIDSARFELYVKHFAGNICAIMSIFCKLAILFERYTDLKQNKLTRFLNRIPFVVSFGIMVLVSVCCFVPLLFNYKIDILSNVEDFFLNKIFLLNLKHARRFFLRKNHTYENFLDFFMNNTIYGLVARPPIHSDRIFILNVLIDIGSIVVIIVMISILLFGMQSRADIKRSIFFKSILDSYPKMVSEFKHYFFLKQEASNKPEIIDAFAETPDITDTAEIEARTKEKDIHLLIVFVKSASDINKEKLIAMAISMNFFLAVNRLADLVYLLARKLSIWHSFFSFNIIYLNVMLDFLDHFSKSIDLFFYLAFDKNFRKSYENIFKHICYFKMHLPKHNKNTILKV